jgi:hypothetical protein
MLHQFCCVISKLYLKVYSIDWCAIRGNNKLLSGSWDKTIKLVRLI